MAITIQDDMIAAAEMMPRRQADAFLVALVRYGMSGEEPEGRPAWLPTFVVCRDRIDMSGKATERARRMADARWGKEPSGAMRRHHAQASASSDAQASASADAQACASGDAQAPCTGTDAGGMPGQDAEMSRDEMSREEKEKESKEKEGKERGSRRRFAPPTTAEVDAYIAERGYSGFDGEAFCAFYESKGWRVGSSPMRDWRAAVRTWAKRRAKEGGGHDYGSWDF